MQVFKAFILFFIFFYFESIAQNKRINNAFMQGEVLDYEVFYNLGFLKLNAGYSQFKVSESKYNGLETYKYEIIGNSHDGYDWILKVRDYLVSYADKNTLLPYIYKRSTKEGDYRAENTFQFDYIHNKIQSNCYNTEKGYNNKILNLKPNVFDLVSAIYKIRNTNFNTLKSGEIVPFTAIVDGELYNLFIRYRGNETLFLENRKETYNCIKFSVFLIQGTMFNEGENMMVWLSNDKNRIPIKVEAEILVGSVTANLSKYSGLRNELSSLVK